MSKQGGWKANGVRAQGVGVLQFGFRGFRALGIDGFAESGDAAWVLAASTYYLLEKCRDAPTCT